jgi:ATP-dependent protease ClpP protease subunit
MNRIIVSLALLFVATSYQALAQSARVGGRVDCSSGFWCKPNDMEIVGTIDSSTFEKFKRLIDGVHERAIREKKEAQLALELVGLNSPGGSVPAAMAIGRILRKERLTAIVPFDGECYSACVLIFAGAVSRMNAGKVGIHRPYLELNRQEVSAENVKDSYQRMLQEIRSYFREINVSDQLADAMLRIEPEEVRLLDDVALSNYGLTPTDPIEQETQDLQDAKAWGLNRQEYIRRKSTAARMCPGKYNFGAPDPDSECYQTTMKTGQAPPNSVPQDEATFDRQMCIKVGKRGPEIEDCVQASALWRRSMR